MTDAGNYQAPSDLWDMDAQLQFNEALEPGDPRYVPTAEARGNFSQQRLFRTLGVDDRDPEQLVLRKRGHDNLYIAFCGHRGCGKSTELRKLAGQLHHADRFYVVFLDALEELDYNNLRYADVLLALVKDLFAQLEQDGFHIDSVLLQKLYDWFSERVETDARTEELAAEIKSGVELEAGVPFFSKIFSSFTAVMKSASQRKEELRTVVENSFSEFAAAFNTCILAAEDAIQRAQCGHKLLFIIDGTDRLSGEDSARFFIRDVDQLKQIDANFIYCAPIHLIYDGIHMQQNFRHIVLPMIKLHEKGDETPLADGYQTMREMIYQRAAPGLFESEVLVDTLIERAGGNPRDLFKLLHYAFLQAKQDVLDTAAVNSAIQDLAVDYKRILDTTDYPLLRKIDQNPDAEENSERIRFLLYNLALLEYNGYWRQSHPTIRTLSNYQNTPDSPDEE
ncbi:MAG: ATP-binding protein [Pseudomonadota bacterium]